MASSTTFVGTTLRTTDSVSEKVGNSTSEFGLMDSQNKIIDDGVEVSDEDRPYVVAAVEFYNSEKGVSYHLTNIQKISSNDQGGKELKLVLCSGDICEMKTFNVTDTGDGNFSVTVQKSGFF